MKQLSSQQRAIIAIAGNRGGVQFATTQTVAWIVIWFLSSIAAQTVALLAWRGAEFTAFQAQEIAAWWVAGSWLLVYLMYWPLLRRVPYTGG